MMRRIVLIAAFAAVTAAPMSAHAACPQRTTGTVVGAVAGGLLGNAVAGHGARTEGTLLGAAAGGLVGNQVTKCHYSRRAHYRPRAYQRSSYERPQRASYERPRHAAACRYESQPYYDPYGQVVYHPTRVCGR